MFSFRFFHLFLLNKSNQPSWVDALSDHASRRFVHSWFTSAITARSFLLLFRFFCIFTSHRCIWSPRHKYQHTLYNIFDGTLCSHCNVTLEPFSTYFLTTKRTSTSDCPSANRNRIEIEKWNKKMNEKIKWMKSGEKLQQFKLRQTIMFYCSERYFWLRFDELLSLRFECSK